MLWFGLFVGSGWCVMMCCLPVLSGFGLLVWFVSGCVSSSATVDDLCL